MADQENGVPAPAVVTIDQNTVVSKAGESTADAIIDKVRMFVDSGGIAIPKDYSVENAVRFAFLQLQELKDRNNQPVLEVCSRNSVATAILKMAIQGLSLAKNQCYLIPYGNQLTFQRSAYGSVALAKRVSNVTEIKGVVIFQDDEFSFEILPTGRKNITCHKQTLESIATGAIRGAYAIITFSDGSTDVDVMTYGQISASWSQGKAGTKTHEKFPEEMCKKTIINRAAKTFINESNDSDLMKEDEPESDKATADVAHEVVTNANKKQLGFTEPAKVMKVQPAKESAPVRQYAPTAPVQESEEVVPEF